ncbi:type II toxin-antitoxin system CcdA family antitoxin [Meridianimarinicoccus roseus]|uniref:type II toxin-antitoxin system CcdA family antitoxin n=1 Tax=Meridianimarinicoccus roseus TaxID=2072018 RepID=UPI001EE63A2F|nr:type II toxin-antitoxin system CcdA family antitoxin [Meridianimarinicoccus roseus]
MAISEAAKVERNRRWSDENKAAIAAYAEQLLQEGLPLAGFASVYRPVAMPQFDHYRLKGEKLVVICRRTGSASTHPSSWLPCAPPIAMGRFL